MDVKSYSQGGVNIYLHDDTVKIENFAEFEWIPVSGEYSIEQFLLSIEDDQFQKYMKTWLTEE